jgi:hypothetical protein
MEKPKKLKLSDYEIFQTLGTGTFILLIVPRFFRQSKTGQK